MEFFDLDEIRDKADCKDIAVKLGGSAIGPNGRGSAAWRGGDGFNVAFGADGKTWYDHAEKRGGGSVELYCEIKKLSMPRDAHDVAEGLGEFLGLRRSLRMKVMERRKLEGEYIYKDIGGDPRHKVMRYRHGDGSKEFIQYRFADGEWKPGLGDCETLPYMLDQWSGAKTVYLHEGEKKADATAAWGLPSTSFPMGAGTWKPEWAKWFKNKEIIICKDNDDAGNEHAARLMWELKSVADRLKTLFTSAATKGDVCDYIAEGKSRENFLKLVEAAAWLDKSLIYEPSTSEMDKLVKIAKKENETPFKNYFLEQIGADKSKSVKRPRPMADMLTDLSRRLLRFPRRVGGEMLFDHDRRSGEIRYLRDATQMKAWMDLKTGHNTAWGRIEGGVSPETFYETVKAEAQCYEGISGVPFYPARSDVYFTFGDLPEPHPEYKYFHDLLSFFLPADTMDRALFAAAFVTPMFYAPSSQRPIFVIDTDDGPGSGKTKLVEMIALLYGDPNNKATHCPIDLDYQQLGNEQLVDRISRRLLSHTARNKRIVRIDNVSGYFTCPVLSTWTTQPYLSGLPPYAHGEEVRPSDMTFFLTCNTCTISEELLKRCLIAKVKKPEAYSAAWDRNVYAYIQSHRYQIFADMISCLDVKTDIQVPNMFRFPEWEDSVLRPLCGSGDAYEALWKLEYDRKLKANGDKENSDTIHDRIVFCLTRAGFDTDEDVIWIQSGALIIMIRDAIPGFGGREGKSVKYIIKQYKQHGLLKALKDKPDVYPANGKYRTRGMMWDVNDKHRAHGIVRVAALDENNKICETIVT